MSAFEELIPYVEDNTTVVDVRSSHLERFLMTVNFCETKGYGKDVGVFKMKVSEGDRRGGTALKELLLPPFQKRISDCCILQEFRRYPLCSDVYGYKRITPSDPIRTRAFRDRMILPETYTTATDTCCTKELAKGTDEVLSHLFEHLAASSVHSASGRSKLKQKPDLEELLVLGKKLKCDHDLVMKSMSSSSEAHKFAPKDLSQNPVWTNCTCEDCFSESESEEESDECSVQFPPAHLEKHEISKTHVQAQELRRCASGFTMTEGVQVNITEGFDLGGVYSVLNLVPHQCSSLQEPYFCISEEHTVFIPILQDVSLYFASFLHYGKPKLWITIPEEHCKHTAELLGSTRMELSQTSCRNALNHGFFMLTIQFLKKHNIRYNVTIQHEGEFLIVYGNVINFGFSLGPSISEAIVFGTEAWILKGVESRDWRCRCHGDSMQHLDLKPLVAAFYPDKLIELYDREIHRAAPSQGLLKVADNPDNQLEWEANSMPMQLKSRKVRTYRCPYPGCKAAYAEHRKRLEHHVKNEHGDHAKEYMSKIGEEFPKSLGCGNSCRLCPVCGASIKGSATHLRLHMTRQIKKEKIDSEKKKLYVVALQSLCSTVRLKKNL